MERLGYSPKEVAEAFNVTDHHIRELVRQFKIPRIPKELFPTDRIEIPAAWVDAIRQWNAECAAQLIEQLKTYKDAA